MIRHGQFVAALLTLAAGLIATVGCGYGSPSSPSTSTATATPSLALTGSSQMDLVGLTNSLVAIATQSSGATNVTSLATWQSSNPAAVTVSSTGVATSVSAGTTTITATYQGLTATITVRVGAFVDCLSYQPTTLQLLADGGNYNVVAPASTGFLFFATYATEADGRDGLALFQQYRDSCYVGRNNARANRSAYVVPYWLNQFGLQTTISREDCEPYDKSTVVVVSSGTAGWSLMASGRQLLLLDNAADATTMLSVVRTYSNQCYIGRGNAKSNPADFVTTYWK